MTWRPFSSGAQFADWRDLNCNKCKKGYVTNWNCDIEHALDYAYIVNGHVSDSIAARMGREEKKYLWTCHEFVDTLSGIH